MAYGEGLAQRVREVLCDCMGYEEKKMCLAGLDFCYMGTWLAG